MKESDVPGLLELKVEFESKLADLKEYQELKSELERASRNLIKEAIRRKGIKLEPELEVSPRAATTPSHIEAISAVCGFCTNCITSCTGCVAHIAS